MFVNVTPHAVTIHQNGDIMVVPASGVVARCATTDKIVGQIDGVDIHAMSYGELDGLPEPKENVIYIASMLAAQAAKRAGRSDVYAPGPAIRDDEGRIVGCQGLSLP
jgi:hypothetical protein